MAEPKASELKGRKILMFRTHIDPMVGPKPKNAFHRKDHPNWSFEFLPMGIYIKAVHQVPGGKKSVTEHVIPFANVQSLQFIAPEDEEQYCPKAVKEPEVLTDQPPAGTVTQ